MLLDKVYLPLYYFVHSSFWLNYTISIRCFHEFLCYTVLLALCCVAGVFCAVVSHPFDTIVSKLNQKKGSSFLEVGKSLGWKGAWRVC